METWMEIKHMNLYMDLDMELNAIFFLAITRCLSIEAPPPEDKLATLSDIAQEYGVEWDAHTAARDMLPSGPPPGIPPPPGNPSGAWGAGAGGGPPTGPPGGPPGGFHGTPGGQHAPNRFPGAIAPCHGPACLRHSCKCSSCFLIRVKEELLLIIDVNKVRLRMRCIRLYV